MKANRFHLVGSRTRQAGFSLLDAVFWLIIAGIGIAFVVSQFGSTNTSSRASNVAQSTSRLQSKVIEAFKPDFSAVTSCADLARTSAFTGTTFTVDSTYNVTWGDSPTSSLTCAPANLFGTNDGLALTFNGMADDECNGFVTKVNNLAWNISVNGTQVKANRGTLNPVTQGTQCTATATTDNQVVLITIGRTSPGR